MDEKKILEIAREEFPESQKLAAAAVRVVNRVLAAQAESAEPYPTAYMRGVQIAGGPEDPPEWDVEFTTEPYGKHRWTPLYLHPQQQSADAVKELVEALKDARLCFAPGEAIAQRIDAALAKHGGGK